MRAELKQKLILAIRIMIVLMCIAIIVCCSIFLAKESKEVQLEAPELSITVGDDGVIRLTWTYINGASNYRVYRNKNNEGWYVVNVNNGSNNLYKDSVELETETCCRYKIVAVHTYNSQSVFSEPSNICTYLGNMQVPSSIVAEKVGQTAQEGIRVVWEKSCTASGYHLFRLVNGSKLEFVAAMAYTVNEYVDTNIDVNTRYEYKVRAINFWTDGPTVYSQMSTKSGKIQFGE